MDNNTRQRLLIVDDHRTNLLLLDKLFSEEYEVTTFLKPVEALYRFSSESYDLVISDFTMPEMDGIELLKEIKQIDPYVPFIMISANNDKENVHAAYQAGVEHYVFKPLNISALVNTVKSLINS